MHADLDSAMAMTPSERSDRLRELELASRAVEAEQAVLVTAAHRSRDFEFDGHRSIRGQLRADLHWSEAAITRRLRIGTLLGDCHHVLALLADGEIGTDHAALLGVARSNPRSGDQLAEHLGLLTGYARSFAYRDFQVLLDEWERHADTDGALADAKTTHANRRVTIDINDGAGHLTGQGSSLDLAEFQTTLERFEQVEFDTDWALARQQHGADATASDLPRSARQRRFDALIAMARAALATPADAQPPEPVLNITMDLQTFEAACNRLDLTDFFPEPTTEQLDPMPVEQRRSHTADGIWVEPTHAIARSLFGHVRRVICDSDGVTIDLGRKRRLFTGSARTAAQLSATRCIWPGCTMPLTRCQVDHNDEWQHGGHTTPGNANLLCGLHNRHKSATGARIERTGRHHQVFRDDGTQIGGPLKPKPPDRQVDWPIRHISYEHLRRCKHQPDQLFDDA